MLACAPLCHQQNYDKSALYREVETEFTASYLKNLLKNLLWHEVRYGPTMNIAIWVHPLKSLPLNDLECRQKFPYIFFLNPEVLYALTLARISIYCLLDSLDIISFSTYLQVPSSCSVQHFNRHIPNVVQLIKGSQLSILTYINLLGLKQRIFNLPQPHTACASHRCRVYRLLHGKVSAQGSQQKPAVSRISTH